MKNKQNEVETEVVGQEAASGAMTGYEKSPYTALIIIKHKGVEYSGWVDMSADCDENGVLPQSGFDYWIRILKLSAQGRLYALKALHFDLK